MCEVAGCDASIVPGLRGVMSLRKPYNFAARKLTHTPRRSWEHSSPESALLPSLQSARQSCDILFTIGQMTNLAASLLADPDVSRFPRVIAMAGEFQRGGHVEWNIWLDPEAACICFDSGVPIDLIPWSIGPATKLLPQHVERLRAARSPLTQLLIRMIDEFWTHVPSKSNMYDPMTVVALLKPDLFEWQRGRVTVETRGSDATYGLTTFKPDPVGPHRVAFGVQADPARDFLIDRICSFQGAA
jgi:inosine-uridine nucleoside N-ribohydrolase